MTQLPPQDPNDYPYIKGASASSDGAHDSQVPAQSNLGSLHVGRPAAAPGAGYPGEPPPLGGVQPPPAGPGGYPWGAPGPAPYVPYPPPVLVPVPGSSWNDPALIAGRKRTTNRRVAISGSIVGLITAIIQLIVTATLFLAPQYLGPPDFGVLLAMLIIFFGPIVVGIGWISSFIVSLIACVQAHSRDAGTQPEGWSEAKMPTSALMAASIVLGIPIVIMYTTLIKMVQSDIDRLIDDLFGPVVVSCAVVQVLLTAGYIYLLRRSTALDASVSPRATSEGVPQ